MQNYGQRAKSLTKKEISIGPRFLGRSSAAPPLVQLAPDKQLQEKKLTMCIKNQKLCAVETSVNCNSHSPGFLKQRISSVFASRLKSRLIERVEAGAGISLRSRHPLRSNPVNVELASRHPAAAVVPTLLLLLWPLAKSVVNSTLLLWCRSTLTSTS